MWSQILAEILDCGWTNLSQAGAGNEAIANLVLDQLAATADTSDSLWIVQWTHPQRLDLLEWQRFSDSILQDPVYHKNFIRTAKGQEFWCSSASHMDLVRTYHSMITESQQESRSRISQLATGLALSQRDVRWRFCLTYPADWREIERIGADRWILPSMREYRESAAHRELDVGYIQPVSSVYLDWLEEFILPGLDHDPDRLSQARQRYRKLDQQRLEMGFDPHNPR
jgi:hypothetical protein